MMKPALKPESYTSWSTHNIARYLCTQRDNFGTSQTDLFDASKLKSARSHSSRTRQKSHCRCKYYSIELNAVQKNRIIGRKRWNFPTVCVRIHCYSDDSVVDRCELKVFTQANCIVSALNNMCLQNICVEKKTQNEKWISLKNLFFSCHMHNDEPRPGGKVFKPSRTLVAALLLGWFLAHRT